MSGEKHRRTAGVQILLLASAPDGVDREVRLMFSCVTTCVIEPMSGKGMQPMPLLPGNVLPMEPANPWSTDSHTTCRKGCVWLCALSEGLVWPDASLVSKRWCRNSGADVREVSVREAIWLPASMGRCEQGCGRSHAHYVRCHLVSPAYLRRPCVFTAQAAGSGCLAEITAGPILELWYRR